MGFGAHVCVCVCIPTSDLDSRAFNLLFSLKNLLDYIV